MCTDPPLGAPTGIRTLISSLPRMRVSHCHHGGNGAGDGIRTRWFILTRDAPVQTSNTGMAGASGYDPDCARFKASTRHQASPQ